MTQFLTANIGSYPRIGEEKDQQRHRRALSHLQNKEISPHAFHDVEQSVVQEIVREQLLTGLDEVTDGCVSWHDSISHFCRKISGIHLKSLMRLYDTNTYYREPVFIGKPRKKDSAVLSDYQFSQGISNKPVRVVLTGPYTLATHTRSETKAYSKFQDRLRYFTDHIAGEITTLIGQGAKKIQIDEPAILRKPEDIQIFKNSLLSLIEKSKSVQLSLALYFSAITPLYDHLKDLPIYSLNLDFTHDGKRLFEKITQSPPKAILGFGILNGRNTRLEPIDPILNNIRQWITKVSPASCYITPSCGLDFLPRSYAFEKLKLIQKIKEEMGLSKSQK